MAEIGSLQARLQRLLGKRTELGKQRELLQQRGVVVDALTESLNNEHDQLSRDEKANTEALQDIREKLKELERDMAQEHRNEAKEFTKEADGILRELDKVVPHHGRTKKK